MISRQPQTVCIINSLPFTFKTLQHSERNLLSERQWSRTEYASTVSTLSAFKGRLSPTHFRSRGSSGSLETSQVMGEYSTAYVKDKASCMLLSPLLFMTPPKSLVVGGHIELSHNVLSGQPFRYIQSTCPPATELDFNNCPFIFYHIYLNGKNKKWKREILMVCRHNRLSSLA